MDGRLRGWVLRPKDRRARISEIIERQGQATVEDLALAFEVSAETIRRDLSDLAEEGRVQKIHGGAKKMRFDSEGSFQQRMAENAGGKARIAEKLAHILRPGDTIFIDTGSTTLAAAAALARIDRLTAITNSARVARELGDRGDVYLLGGAYRSDNAQTVGPLAIEQISGFVADYAVLTVAGLDPEAGAVDYNIEEAQVARAMIAHARDVIVVADASKFGRRAPFRVCGLERIGTLVVDEPPPAALGDALVQAGVRIV